MRIWWEISSLKYGVIRNELTEKNQKSNVQKSLAASLVLIAAQATTFNQLDTNEFSQSKVFEDGEVNLEDYNLQPITCTPPGTYEYTTRENRHHYFNKGDYRELDAQTKQDQLWEMLTENDSVAC